MCNSRGNWDMAQLDHAGFAGRDPLHAVTFLENHDTDLNSPVVFNKILGYAYLLTSEGYPKTWPTVRPLSATRNSSLWSMSEPARPTCWWV
jgi:hypothetical protein